MTLLKMIRKHIMVIIIIIIIIIIAGIISGDFLM